MAKRGRPRSPRAASAKIIRIKLRLYPGEDDDLLEFFSGIPAGLRATMVKLALRSGVAGEEVPAEDDALTFLLEALVN